MPPLRRPTLDENNRWYTAVVVGGGGVAGSLISFLYTSALALGLWRLALGLIALPKDRSVRLIGAAFAAYYLAQSVSTLVNYREPWNLYQGLVENIPFLAFLVIFARLSLTARDEVLRWVGYGAVGGALGAGAFALVEIFVLGAPRAEGLAGNSGPFALVCAVLYGFCIAIAIHRRGRMRGLAAAATLFAAIGLILSGMRSLWPMLVVSPLLMAWLLGALRWPRVPAQTSAAVLAAALVVAALAYGTIHDRVMSLVADVANVTDGNYDNSLGQRLRVWDGALELIAQNPLFGVGPGNVRSDLHAATLEPGMKELAFSHAHNMVLNALVRSGVFGLLAVVAMFAVPLWLAARAPKDAVGRVGFALMASFCAVYLVNGAVNISFGHDIADALYLYCMIVTSYLVFGPSSLPSHVLLADGRRVPAEPNPAIGT